MFCNSCDPSVDNCEESEQYSLGQQLYANSQESKIQPEDENKKTDDGFSPTSRIDVPESLAEEEDQNSDVDGEIDESAEGLTQELLNDASGFDPAQLWAIQRLRESLSAEQSRGSNQEDWLKQQNMGENGGNAEPKAVIRAIDQYGQIVIDFT